MLERMELDEDGFPQPTGELEELEADSLVLALGQESDLGAARARRRASRSTTASCASATDLMTGRPGVFAGGDIVPAERTVTAAIGHGRARRARHRRLPARRALRARRRAGPPATFDALNPWYYDDAPRTVRPTLELARRAVDLRRGHRRPRRRRPRCSRRAAACRAAAASRCDNCYGVCPDNAVIKLEPGGAYAYAFDLDYCKGCGLCVQECPSGRDRDGARADLMSAASRPRADVRDHRFGAGPPFTVGVEEEYMLLDPETFDLVPRAESILAAEAGGDFAENVSPELFESLVEFHTRRLRRRPAGGPRAAPDQAARGRGRRGARRCGSARRARTRSACSSASASCAATATAR